MFLLCPGVLVVLWWSDGQVGVVIVHGSFEAVVRALGFIIERRGL